MFLTCDKLPSYICSKTVGLSYMQELAPLTDPYDENVVVIHLNRLVATEVMIP